MPSDLSSTDLTLLTGFNELLVRLLAPSSIESSKGRLDDDLDAVSKPTRLSLRPREAVAPMTARMRRTWARVVEVVHPRMSRTGIMMLTRGKIWRWEGKRLNGSETVGWVGESNEADFVSGNIKRGSRLLASDSSNFLSCRCRYSVS